ncbi:MAG: hypothetical protein MZW92_60125 [Comamonadaceae bacterium]|nr:hypothetical protein [Comamonadaceae bacterium]
MLRASRHHVDERRVRLTSARPATASPGAAPSMPLTRPATVSRPSCGGYQPYPDHEADDLDLRRPRVPAADLDLPRSASCNETFLTVVT